ncbi:hypothetical protein [Acinetobacter higginsii]|uniref:hypothetical protein n=1 Tax=Acinetobacter higginsii TaxID=70347 RepID=UPI001F4ABD78|nr:hypothetical protein [Acinetobacter higginsii]MCH7381182.1 hypothetical protein [Acinetobacter higginsii]
MADVLSRVQILLDADTARFEQRMNAAPATATGAFEKIKSGAKIMAAVVASAALASAGAMISYADQQVKTINELERFAYLAQATVPEFQKMAAGAEMFGIEQDKLADITKDFNEKLGEMATVGGGGALDFIEQVGIKTEGSADGAMKLLKNISELSGPEGMALYVAKMEEANLSQKQMSFLMESMASDSTMLLPLLKNNAEGMKLWGAAAEDTGIILDEQTIKSARQMQVETSLMEKQLQGVKNQFTAALIPALVDVAGAFKNGGKEATGMANAGEVLANVLRGVASVAIGVYATVNMIANSMAGVTKSAVDSYKLADDAAKNGSWFDKLPGVKLLKAGVNFSVTAKAENSGIGMAMEDNAKVIEQTAESLNNMWDSIVSESIKKMTELQLQASKTTAAATQGTQDWLDKQNKVNEANQKVIQAQKELDQLQKQQSQARQQISEDYADDFKKLNIDYQKQVDEINKANFGAEASKYLGLAKERYDFNSEMYLRQITEEINAHKWSEERKLEYFYETQREIVENSGRYNDELKQLKLDSLKEQEQQELAWLRLEQAQRISDAGSMLRTDLQNMEIRYGYERDQILLNSKLSEDEQKKRLALSMASEDFEKRRNLNDAAANWGGTFADMNGTRDQYQLEQERFTRYDDSQALFDSQMTLAETAAEREAIWQAHNERMIQIDQAYADQSSQLNFSYGEQIAGSYADMFKSILGEQSAAYKAMFVVEKAAAIARSMIAIQSGIAQAANNPFPLNLAAMASVAASTGSLISNIQSVAGVFHGGQDYVPQEASYLLQRGERVLTPDQNVDFTKFMSEGNRFNGMGPNINITNNTPAKVSARQDSNGQISITMDEVEQFVSNSLGRPNSRISKAFSQNTNAGRRR